MSLSSQVLHNAAFNPLEFKGVKAKAGANALTLSPKRWVANVAMIGQTLEKTGDTLDSARK